MRRIILVIGYLMVLESSYSQDKNDAYYLRKAEQFTAAGKLNSYEIMHFSGSNVELIIVEVMGKIGNPITTDFFIDTCYMFRGMMESVDSGYLLLSDGGKKAVKIKKRSDRKLTIDYNGDIAKYNRISKSVNFLVKLESYCFCQPLVPAASKK